MLTAVEVLETMKEICNTCYENCRIESSGEPCPLDKYDCGEIWKYKPEEIVEVCEKWQEEHKVKTYADHFFKQFPNAERRSNNIPVIAFYRMYGGEWESAEKNIERWLQPYPKEKDKNHE